VCNLLSICLPTFVNSSKHTFDFEKLHEISMIVAKNLNKVIDVNFYPVDKARVSNLRHRPIGIGVQGLADTFALLRYPFESNEAKQLNVQIFETIYHGALESSMSIAKKRHEVILLDDANYDLKLTDREDIHGRFPGAYSSFEGSPASQGILQFDMWNIKPSDRYDWDSLKSDIKKYGIRNSLLLAQMPTASTSQIMGFNEACEPFTSNIYKRKTMSGEFIMINRYLIADLIRLNLWSHEMKEKIIINDGSIQNIAEIPDDIKALYKIVFEIKMKNLIDMSADRGAYICQSQSLNLWMEDPNYQKLSTMHFYSWSKHLKTACYYLRTRTQAKSQKFTIDPEVEKKEKKCDEDVCLVCSA